jgi:hypothetical protein
MADDFFTPDVSQPERAGATFRGHPNLGKKQAALVKDLPQDAMNAIVAFNTGFTGGLSTHAAALVRKLSSKGQMTYDEALEAERAEQEARRAESPVASLAGSTAGATVGPGKVIAAAPLGAFGRITAASALGGLSAANAGGDVVEGAMYGGAGAGIGEGVGAVVKGVRSVGDKQTRKVIIASANKLGAARDATRTEISKQLGIDATKLDDLYVDKLTAVIKKNPAKWTFDVPEQELATMYVGKKLPAIRPMHVAPSDYGSKVEYLAALTAPKVGSRLAAGAKGVALDKAPLTDALRSAVKEMPGDFVQGTLYSGGNPMGGAAVAKGKFLGRAGSWIGNRALAVPESALRKTEGVGRAITATGQIGAQYTEPTRSRLGEISDRVRFGGAIQDDFFTPDQ